MEGVPALREIIEKDDFIVKLDLKDAYTVVPTHKDSRPFLAFENQSFVYQYKALNVGLNITSRIFTKLLRHALEPLRKSGGAISVLFRQYLSDGSRCKFIKKHCSNGNSTSRIFRIHPQ